MYRDIYGNMDQDDLVKETTFSDCCKASPRLAGKHFNKYSHHFYTSLLIFVPNFGISYSNKDDIKKYRGATWNMVDYYYWSIHYEIEHQQENQVHL